MPLEWAAELLGITAAALYALGLARLARTWGAGRPQTLLLVLLGLLAGRTPHHLLNGLETGLAFAGFVWALALASRPPGQRWWMLPLLCGQLPFLRPELVVVALLLPAARVLGAGEGREDLRGKVRGLTRDAALVLAAALPWAIWYWVATGAPYPSTIGAKRLFFADGCLPAFEKLTDVAINLVDVVLAVGTLAVGVVALPLTWVGRAALAFGAVFIATFFVEFPFALAQYEHRYLYLLLPLPLLGVIVLWRSPRRWVRRAGTILVVLALAQAAWQFPVRWSYYRGTCRFTREELAGVAQWCTRSLPPESVLLVHDIGYLSWATQFRLVDAVGLKSPENVNVHREITWPSCGAERVRAIAEIARRRDARLLVVLQGWDDIMQLTAGLPAQGWRVIPLRGAGDYKVYALRQAGGAKR